MIMMLMMKMMVLKLVVLVIKLMRRGTLMMVTNNVDDANEVCDDSADALYA